jgi:hypothetical protein
MTHFIVGLIVQSYPAEYSQLFNNSHPGITATAACLIIIFIVHQTCL